MTFAGMPRRASPDCASPLVVGGDDGPGHGLGSGRGFQPGCRYVRLLESLVRHSAVARCRARLRCRRAKNRPIGSTMASFNPWPMLYTPAPVFPTPTTRQRFGSCKAAAIPAAVSDVGRLCAASFVATHCCGVVMRAIYEPPVRYEGGVVSLFSQNSAALQEDLGSLTGLPRPAMASGPLPLLEI